jgi:hypothetical protein
MPSSSTVTPRALRQRDHPLQVVMRAGQRQAAQPSLAPSSSTTMRGCCSSSACGRRARPAAVVSPLTLAFIDAESVP